MQLTIPVCDVLCVYGVPDGELEAHLRSWLEEENRCVVIFDEGEVRDFDDERIRFSGVDEEDLRRIAWEFVFLQFDYLERCGNPSKDEAKREALFAKMAYFQSGVHLVASDFQDRGVNFLHNFMKNASLFPKVADGRSLFGGFKDVPAIICGAGPSLEKEIPYLRTLKDRALLFAGGTAMSSLSHFDMRPHFGGVIDPHKPPDRFFKHQAFEVPLFFQSRAHPLMIESMQGPLLWIPGSKNDLLEKETFDGGWNVSTFLAALACHMGCSPIILVGVDLSESAQKSYAGGFTREGEGEPLELDDGVLTRKDWLFARDWLSEFAEKHPEVQWLNASDGMEIKGFEKSVLRDFSFDHQEDLFGEVHSHVQRMEKGIVSDFDLESFERVGVLCEKMLKLLEGLFPNPPEKDGEYVLLILEIEKEVAFDQFLLPIWGVWKHVFKRELAADIPESYGIELNKWLFVKGICDEARDL